jgi:hypothetical protein
MGQYIDNDVIQTLNKPKFIELIGGQAMLHSFDCVHAYRSDKPRVGLALRYMTSTVRQTDTEKSDFTSKRSKVIFHLSGGKRE